MIVILILVGYILACILWYNLGKFILAIIAYGFKWNLIKEEMKNTPDQLEQVFILFWPLIVLYWICCVVDDFLTRYKI
jgi:hypothetical protein